MSVHVDPPNASSPELGPTQENLEVIASFESRENAEVSPVQAGIERISSFFGSPAYFAFVALFVVLWASVNAWGAHAGWRHVDEPPFFWLQGIVSSNALLLTVAVLIRQNRMAQLVQHRAHLDLQINLLTEQKVTRLLQVVDDLRKRLPCPPGDASDADVEDMSKPANPEAILAAIKQKSNR